MNILPKCHHRTTDPRDCYMTNPFSYSAEDKRSRNPPPACEGHCTHPERWKGYAHGYVPPCREVMREKRCPEGHGLEAEQ